MVIRKMKVRFILSFLLLLGGVSVVQAADRLTLQLKWDHSFQFAGFYVAKERGFYRELGLDVHLEPARPGVDPVRQVVSGKAQYGVGNSSLLLERYAGRPLVAVAAIFQHSPMVLIAAEKGPVPTVHDLAGKRVMLEPQAGELVAYLEASGIPFDRINHVRHSFDVKELIDGKVHAISAYTTDEPYFLAQAGFRYQLFTPRSVGIDFYGDTLFTTESELERHPQRVAAFRKASLRGWAYAMAHPDEVAAMIQARYSPKLGMDFLKYQADEMRHLLRTDLIEVGYMNPGRWRHIADVYADIGLLPVDYSIDAFLYDANPSPDMTWLYISIAIGLLVATIALYIHRVNVRLKRSLEASLRAERGLEGMLRESSKRDIEQRQLLSFASHEFRSPTAMIQATLDSLRLLEKELPSEVTQRLGNIRIASRRLNELANTFIGHERVTTPGLEPELVEEDMTKLLRNVVARYPVDTRLQVKVPVGPVMARVDAVLMGIALHNLIDNALRYHEDEHTAVQVTLDESDNDLQLSVADHGPGIPDSAKADVFERYRSGVSDSVHGLGLSIVQAVADAHGGSVAVYDNVPSGALFLFKIPSN